VRWERGELRFRCLGRMSEVSCFLLLEGPSANSATKCASVPNSERVQRDKSTGPLQSVRLAVVLHPQRGHLKVSEDSAVLQFANPPSFVAVTIILQQSNTTRVDIQMWGGVGGEWI